MKGKILFGLIGLVIGLLVFSGYLNLSTVNSAIEFAAGVKTVSVDELKQMAEEGKIPYEVYRLALYEKLKDPSVAFRIHDEVVEDGVMVKFGDYEILASVRNFLFYIDVFSVKVGA